jgi:Bacterial Ig-like domain (group 1)
MSMNVLKRVLGVLLVATVAACGGGGGSSGTGAGQPVVPATQVPVSVEVLASANALPSAGAGVLITAFVKNSANIGLAAQKVAFSASSGGLQAVSTETDPSGAATAKLIVGSDKSIRDIKVTVTAGGISGNVTVSLTGTRVSISGAGSLQAGGAASSFTVNAIDSSNNPILGAQIAVGSALKNGLSSSTLTTDGTGSATFLYTPNLAGNDTLTVSGLGSVATATVLVSAIDFVAVSPASNTDISTGAPQTVSVRYRLSGVGVAGQKVSFVTTRGVFTVAEATTDATGLATTVLSSSTAGRAVVVAQITGVGSVNLPVQFVAATPASIVVQANPGSVLPNTSGNANQSTIEAVVRDATGNAVANRQVNFTALQDLSNGTLSPGISTTDANGRAQVQFIPGAAATQANGVIIQAQVASTTITSTTTLTVNGKALFITLGFGNTITNVDETTYSKPFTVYVTDANGVAVGNQLLSISVIPEAYRKGFLQFAKVWALPNGVPAATCANEDKNLNGILDAGEDTNKNGQLTPGNVVVAAPGNVTTDGFGRATFNLQYGEQFVPWVTVRLTARASVAGTESVQSIRYDLDGLASDFTSDTIQPAGRISPFGQSTLCTNPD